VSATLTMDPAVRFIGGSPTAETTIFRCWSRTPSRRACLTRKLFPMTWRPTSGNGLCFTGKCPEASRSRPKDSVNIDDHARPRLIDDRVAIHVSARATGAGRRQSPLDGRGKGLDFLLPARWKTAGPV